MLVSHRKKFIFTKTIKTAGTSVEAYFEQYCMKAGEWNLTHWREEYETKFGIIGFRGGDKGDARWYNHMPAKAIRTAIGNQIWESYFKFTIIRNPFDKLISHFYFINKNKTFSDKEEVDYFRAWIKNISNSIDREQYVIDDKICMDYFIRFEKLYEGIEDVCTQLDIPFVASEVPSFKQGIRPHQIAIKDYYNQESIDKIQRLYEWELNEFGYDVPVA